MRLSQSGNIVVQFGDSLDDVVRYLRTTPRVWTYNNSKTNDYGHRWTFGLDYEGALELALKGWPDGTDRLAKGVKAMPAPQAVHHKRQFDVGVTSPMSAAS